jgi:glutamate dehydrogenase (NAD(P)+)
MEREAVIAADCDIFVPAARPDVITDANAHQVKATLVLEGANIPATPKAEIELHGRGVLCLPDCVVNAGGVICAAAEYAGAGRARAFELIAQTIDDNTRLVIERSRTQGALPRAVAEEIATERVIEAMSFRRRWIEAADGPSERDRAASTPRTPEPPVVIPDGGARVVDRPAPVRP